MNGMDRYTRTVAVIIAVVIINTTVDAADGRNLALVLWCGVVSLAVIACAVFWPSRES